MRAYKTVNDTYIEPISFTVPRRAETFQSDIFPPATGLRPAVSAEEWLSGKTGLPAKLDFESIYEGHAPKEVPADYKPPAAAPAPAPVAKPTPKKESEPEPVPEPVSAPAPVAARAPPPSMKEQEQSMSAMASKFQDDDDDEEDDDDDDETSSFEEISKPTQRSAVPVRSDPKPASPIKETPVAQASPVKPQQQLSTHPPASQNIPTPTAAPSGTSVESSLEQIKQLLVAQSKIISTQTDRISHLASEVDTLRKRVGSGSQDQSERIRQLE
ncbi:MAG: hypothetical protein OK454_02735, partial [Thaumarchaeota archaeon]|nr:hypothetical protein [Nitrososphaerota archaeon]